MSLGHHFIRGVYTLDEQVSGSLIQERLVAWLSASFAALALLLAGIGVFGLLACTVSRRTREIAIRIALARAIVPLPG